MKAYIVVEDSVIIPMCVLIIMTLVLVTLDLHDNSVIKGVDTQLAMKIEQEFRSDNHMEAESVKTAVTHIKAKCMLDGDVNEDVVKRRLLEEDIVTDNNHPKFIRLISAGLKLVD